MALPTRRRSEWETRHRQQEFFRKVGTIYTKYRSKDEFLMILGEIQIRLSFYRSFSISWNILLGGLSTQVFSSWAWARGDLESSLT